MREVLDTTTLSIDSIPAGSNTVKVFEWNTDRGYGGDVVPQCKYALP